MKICILLFFLLILKLTFPGSNSPKRDFNIGIERLNKKEYGRAISIFQELLDAGYRTPEVYNNLGNAYYMKGKCGKAIVAYYRALQIAPDDEEILYNLNRVYKEVNKTNVSIASPS